MASNLNSDKNVEALRKTVEEQKKVINFCQTKFKEQTGNELEIPQTWSKFLSISEANAPLMDDSSRMFQSMQVTGTQNMAHSIVLGSGSTVPSSGDNFLQSYYDLKLPKKKIDPKKKAKTRTTSKLI